MDKFKVTEKIRCITPESARRTFEDDASRFQNLISHKNRKLHALEMKELQSSAQDPRVLERSESMGICSELKQYKREQLLEEKRRQRLQANNEELRILQRQLQGAYISSQVQQQKQHRLNEQQRDRQRQAIENAEVAASNARLKQSIVEEEERDRQRKLETRKVLHDQMAEINERRREAVSKMQREGEEMQKRIERFHAEDEAERRAAEERRRKENQMVDEFKKQCELEQMKQAMSIANDIEKFRKIAAAREEEEMRRKAEKQRKLNEKLALSEHIGQQVLQLENEKRKRQDVLLDLLVEERKALQDMKHRQYLERQQYQRLQAQAELATTFEEHQKNSKKRHEMSEDDKIFYEEQLRYLAERDKLEQLSNERRRRRQMEHKRDILALIEERKKARMASVAEIIAIDTQLKKEEENRLLEIAEERKRLMLSLPTEVQRCIPPRILRPEEMKLLRET